MKLKQALITAFLLTLVGVTIWEFYWRTQTDYYIAYLEDDRNQWAEERAKVETATSEDVILIGMSRTGYNLNTHVWEATQGIDPIKLTINGKLPGPVLKDVINNTDFNGTIVLGVVPIGVFGSKKGFRYRVAQEWVDHYYNRTNAQKLGHILSKPLQRNLVLLSSSENNGYNDLDLKSLIKTITLDDGRVPSNDFKLVRIGYNDEDRNLIMYDRLVDNIKYQKEITDQWDKALPGLPAYSEKTEKNVTESIKELISLTKKLKDRGGKIIFIRHKAEDGWLKHAEKNMPKAKAWNKFVEQIDAPTYHFQDYDFMSKHYLPDWSHMSAKDAKTYTKDMVNQLIKDGHLTKH
ncbi:hypothetical protein [Seonamhaeicola maritimus]|uniref:Uncharacterized protein n=1 Tax=Seonamhaeicola maritimus TaxID=2591822 RepID=A0A5C7GLI9_9FLAO|nr:hypothetical protein [Seonamhaeicola maritimus]TXG39183.1 hypothetical protein FUA22_04715 [Seonamhaeicola maritimus]